MVETNTEAGVGELNGVDGIYDTTAPDSGELDDDGDIDET